MILWWILSEIQKGKIMEQLSWKIKKSEILWPIQKDDLGINTVSLTVRIPKINKLASFP